jgi:transcriptional regulator with XRE-family HTH domain
MTPGQNIRRHREIAKLTQVQAAAKMGCSQAYWSALERDKKSPTVRTLQKIARVLGCSASHLVA